MPLYDSTISLTKLWIAFKNRESRVYYSIIKYDNQSKEKGIRRLIEVFLRGKHFYGKYRCAIIYDNKTGEELIRFNEFGKEI